MFDLAFLQSHYDQLALSFAQNPLLFAALFFALYVLVTAASLPFATLLTLLAGALFGLWHGVLLVSFASSLGATLAMLMARYVLSGWVSRKFGSRMELLNQGIQQDGAFYLFALRLTPVVPFFVVNLLMGLTAIRAFTFYWVSQLGMLVLTVVYVNAGTQLANLRTLSNIVSPALLGSLALIGIAPLLLKKLMPWIAAIRAKANIYKPWRAVRPKTFERNVIVIGGGAGGLVSAYIAAAVKAKVTLIEAHKMGGDCLNYGCVPSKALIKSAKVAHQMCHASRYGLQDTKAVFSFKAVMQRVRAVIAAIEPHDSVARYTSLGVEVLQGYAKIVNPWTVEIALKDGGTQQLTTRSIVIATGAAPFVPPLAGIEQSGYLTSDTLWDAFAKLDDIPKRITILGGGPIGCELAQALQRLGATVTLIEQDNRLLAREDEDVSNFAKSALEADGVRVLTGNKAVRAELVEASGSNTPSSSVRTERMLAIKSKDGELVIPYDALIVAVGRSARLTGYGLAALGIPTHKTIDTNEYLQTIYPNIYAAGDVAGPYQFTHTAAHQAWYAAVNALFGDFKKFKADYSIIPAATFIDPEIARVGLNEQEAHSQGIAYEVTKYDLDDLDRAIADSAAKGFVKVLTVPGKDKILGVAIVGSNAAEMLAEYVLAMKHGLGLNQVLGTIHTYPTFSEANKYAAGEWKRAHQPEKLLAWVKRFHDWRRG
ncbi:MAG: FAD-dependent oxidoreductase [Cytophagales bacterium]|nr:FAD-dependent oxidoreductase [Cytophagales bacterium]